MIAELLQMLKKEEEAVLQSLIARAEELSPESARMELMVVLRMQALANKINYFINSYNRRVDNE